MTPCFKQDNQEDVLHDRDLDMIHTLQRVGNKPHKNSRIINFSKGFNSPLVKATKIIPYKVKNNFTLPHLHPFL